MMAFDGSGDVRDETLLAAYAGGDQSAARVLTLRHTGPCLNLAFRMLSDRGEAEDVAQEAMLRLWKIAPDWRAGEAKISTWLYRVTRNLCTDRLRKRRNIGLDEAPEPADDTPGVEVRMMEGDRHDALQAALETLPDRQKLAITLRHLEELGNPEIASIMEISVEAVESLLSRGKRTLANRLAGRSSELGYQS